VRAPRCTTSTAPVAVSWNLVFGSLSLTTLQCAAIPCESGREGGTSWWSEIWLIHSHMVYR
jgi:hypothetical protein